MKLKENFVLRQVADTWVVLPMAEATLDFNGMITLNETGAVLWGALERGAASADELAQALVAEYEVSPEEALADSQEFLSKLAEAECLED